MDGKKHKYKKHKLIIVFVRIAKRAISLQKVHLWMEISADCPNRGRRSLTKMDRLRNVQSSVWTLQQILPGMPFFTANKKPASKTELHPGINAPADTQGTLSFLKQAVLHPFPTQS